MVPPTVLVLDGNLGFLFALSQELSHRHIVTIPARTSRQAHSFIARFQLKPNLLVVNCGIAGACRLAEEMARNHHGLHIIAFVSSQNGCSECESLLTARLYDPEDKAPDRIPYCVDVIERTIGQHAPFLVRGS